MPRSTLPLQPRRRRPTLVPGTTQRLVSALIALVFGVLCILCGQFFPGNRANCGNQTMQQGDTCVETYKGHTSYANLDEQEAYNDRQALYLTLGGVLVVLIGGWQVTKEVRFRRQRAAGAAGAAAVPSESVR